MQRSLTVKLMGAVCMPWEEDNKPCNLYKEKGNFTSHMSYILVCKRLSYRQPNKEFMYPGLRRTEGHTCHMGGQNPYPDGWKEHLRSTTCNMEHQTLVKAWLGKVSSGQTYSGTMKGAAAFLMPPPNLAGGPWHSAGKACARTSSSQESTAVQPAGNTP